MLCPLWLTSWRALIYHLDVMSHYFLSLRYVYEFARRHRNIPAGFVLNATQNHVRMAERCCRPAVKNACFLREVAWTTYFWLHSLETLGWHDPSDRGDVGWMYLMLIIFNHFVICNHTHTHKDPTYHSRHNSCYSGKTSYRTVLLDVTTEVTGTEMTGNGGQRVTKKKANYRYSVVGSRNGSDVKNTMSG